jgi:broad specificity polyphosphatase/5'/3'-nucleotidase SurE
MYGIPSLCISYCLQDYSRQVTIEELSMGTAMVSSIAGWVLGNGMPEGVDVIVASVPEYNGSPPGIRETRLAISPLPDIYEEKPDGTYGFLPRTLDFYDGEGEDTDVTAIKEGYISIAPFSLDSLVEKKSGLEEMARDIRNGFNMS